MQHISKNIKEDNLKKLEEWYAPFSHGKPMQLEEAQKLYLNLLQTDKEEKKKVIREKLILGTLPIVYRNIVNSGIMYIAYGEFDILEIMQEAFELWIRGIDEGSLLNINMYSLIFKVNTFYRKLEGNYLKNVVHLRDIIHMERKDFAVFLFHYLKKRVNKEITYPDFQEMFLNFFDFSKVKKIELYQLLENIFQIMNDEMDYFEEEIILRNIQIISPYLVQKSWNRTYNKNPMILKSLVATDELSMVEYKELYKMLYAFLATVNLTKKQHDNLKEYFGLYETESKIFEEIANSKQVSINAIQNSLKQAFANLKKENSKKFLDHLYEDYHPSLESDHFFLDLHKK